MEKPTYSSMKEAEFDVSKPLMVLDSKTSLILVPTSFQFTPDRKKITIVAQTDKRFPVTITEHLPEEMYFDFLTAITGKSLTFNRGILTSFTEVKKPVEESKIKKDGKTRSCETPMFLNR